MKKILLLCMAAAVLAACSKDDKQGKLDPNAPVYISPAPGVKADNPGHLTAKEIVKTASHMSFHMEGSVGSEATMGIGDMNRDLVNNRIVLEKGLVINPAKGTLVPHFINSSDLLLVRPVPPIHFDTLAYVPNAVMREARQKINAAFDKGDYEACYTLFEQAYVFLPITGAEWRELKAKGIE